jgi:SAM-dependent methyltransferase
VTAEDRARWDERHAAAGAPAPGPPEALRGREHELLRTGRALEVACGRGATAVRLAARGLTFDAVDVSPVALAAGAALAAEHGVDARVHWWRHDLDTGLPADCAGGYDVVVCQRFRAPVLYRQLASRLGPGGVLVVSVLSEVGAVPGRWRAPPGELRTAFAGLEVLAHRERDGVADLVARAGHPDAVG